MLNCRCLSLFRLLLFLQMHGYNDRQIPLYEIKGKKARAEKEREREKKKSGEKFQPPHGLTCNPLTLCRSCLVCIHCIRKDKACMYLK